MKKYLVLGGNGFIGKYIVDSLSVNNEVVVADYNIDDASDTDNITYKKLDFITCEDFSSFLDGVDVVIHLISTIVPNENINNINLEIENNVFPTIRLLNDMVKNNVKEIIFVSSGGTVYGEHDNIPIAEDEPKQPICNYGIIKELIEKYLNLYNRYCGINYRIARLANPYSEVVKKGKKQGIIPIFIDQLLNNQQLKIWGDGNDVRDYIYMDDAIDALLKIIEYSGDEKVFNVGTGIGYTINDMLEIIKSELDIQDLSISYEDSRKCDVKNNVLNIERIKNELDWEPKTDLQSGIKKVIKMKKGNN